MIEASNSLGIGFQNRTVFPHTFESVWSSKYLIVNFYNKVMNWRFMLLDFAALLHFNSI